MKTKNTKQKTEHRYAVIVKCDEGRGNEASFKKWRTSDLVNLTQFLDTYHRNWLWFNVYSNRGINKGIQLENFTRYRRPTQRVID